MNLKEILEKEFESDIKVYENKDFYSYYIYKPNGVLYFFLDIRKDGIIILLEFKSGHRVFLENPISDIYWIIFCTKNITWDNNFIFMFKDKIIKREFILNKILNE
jgi:hypothetical protein